jgi:hypothetical protein
MNVEKLQIVAARDCWSILKLSIRRPRVKQLLILSLFAVIVCACGSDEASEPVSGAATTDTESKTTKWKRNSKQRDPKWVMAVEGLPELSGLTVSIIGSLEGGIFSLGSSKLTASISLSPEGETPNIMITFKEQNVRCLNHGAVVSNISGTRVELKGEVECSPTNGDKSDRRKAHFNGWFETKK